MIIKRNYEIELEDVQANETYELIEILNFENNILRGVFACNVSNYHDFYIDDDDSETEIFAKMRIRIKATIDIDNCEVKEFSLYDAKIHQINDERLEVVEYAIDMANDYYDFHSHDYALHADFVVRLTEKEFYV